MTIFKQKNFLLGHVFFAANLILTTPFNAFAATSHDALEVASNVQAIFNYDIFAEDSDVGDVEVKILITPQSGYQISENTSIQAKGVRGEIDLKSILIEEYSHENELIEADNKSYNQKKVYWTKISSSGDDLWLNFSEIENQEQREEGELVGFSIAVLDSIIPAIGEVLAVSQLVFSDTTNAPVNIRFPKKSYHTTLAHLPKFWSLEQQKLPSQLNLLDNQSMSVVQMEVDYKGVEAQMLKGIEISTKHYTLSSKDRESFEIWLALYERNIAYYFQLKGEDEDGPFTIKLKQNPASRRELSQRNGD
ncbi:MAG: hypothetical protein JKX81_13410 [Arenicella sp.]|nr:hypothetical protein [Arenicella sp.]